MISFTCPSCGKFRLPTREQPGLCKSCQKAGLDSHAWQNTLPKRVHLDEQEDGLTFRWRWLSAKFFGLAAFCLLWDGFMLVYYAIAIQSRLPLVVLLVSLFPLLTGLALSAYTLAGFLNTTTLRLDRQGIAIQFDPFPWPGEIVLPLAQISGFTFTRRLSRSDRGARLSCDLWVESTGSARYVLLENLDTPDIIPALEKRLAYWRTLPEQPAEQEILPRLPAEPVPFALHLPLTHTGQRLKTLAPKST